MIGGLPRCKGNAYNGTKVLRINEAYIFHRKQTNLIQALNKGKNKNNSQLKRFMGIQANASILSHDKLDNCNV